MEALIPSTVMETGTTVESEVVAVSSEEIEIILRAQSTRVALTSYIRVTVLGNRRDDSTLRPTGTFFLRNTDQSTYTVGNPPPSLQIRAECLEGKALFTASLVKRPLPDAPENTGPGSVLTIYQDGVLTPINAPGPGYYFGTSASGELGYHPLPASVAGSSSRVWNETPTGGIDGVNAEFTLVTVPAGQSLQLFKNGILMREGASHDLVLSGATITYSAGQIPVNGDSHVASYEF